MSVRTSKGPRRSRPGSSGFRSRGALRARAIRRLAGDSLAAPDRALNARIGSDGAVAAFGDALARGARLHRDGAGALTDPDAVRTWLAQNAAGMTAQTTAAESAASGDLGYSYGRYQRGAAQKPGTYLRVWTREAGGRWRVVVDVLL